MKKLITLAVMMILALPSPAQEKVAERSGKRPSWLGEAEKGYVIVSARNNELEAAREQCLTDIRQAIIEAVAVNVASTTTSYERQEENNGTYDIYRNFQNEVKSTAGKMPFITGISLSDAEVYWEKVQVKKEKRYFYNYHVKYPFSEEQRDALIAEFLKKDREQYAKYLDLKQKYATFTRVEFIAEALNDLKALEAYFFDSTRRDEVTALMRNYRLLYDQIAILPFENSLGDHIFHLSLAGRRVTTSATPRCKSESATEIVVTPAADDMYRVSYNHENGFVDEANIVELLYTFGPRRATYSFNFDLSDERMHVVPYGEIELELFTSPENPEEGVGVVGMMDLRSRHEGAFEVLVLDFAAEGIGSRILVSPEVRFEGKGSHRLYFEMKEKFTVSKKRSALVQGVIKLNNLQTDQTREVKFALPYKIHIR